MRKTLFATAAMFAMALAAPAMAQSMFVPANNGGPGADAPAATTGRYAGESATRAYNETEPTVAPPPHYGFAAPVEQDGMGTGQDGNHH